MTLPELETKGNFGVEGAIYGMAHCNRLFEERGVDLRLVFFPRRHVFIYRNRSEVELRRCIRIMLDFMPTKAFGEINLQRESTLRVGAKTKESNLGRLISARWRQSLTYRDGSIVHLQALEPAAIQVMAFALAMSWPEAARMDETETMKGGFCCLPTHLAVGTSNGVRCALFPPASSVSRVKQVAGAPSRKKIAKG